MSNYFGESSSRIKEMRERILNTKSTICIDRARIITEVYRNNKEKPMVIKRALAVKEILENMKIFIDPAELIVGNQASKHRAAPIFPEYAVKWIEAEIDEFDQRPGDKFFIEEELKPELLDICKEWRGLTLQDKALSMMNEESRHLYDLGMIKAEGNITSGDAHIAVNYDRVLAIGISGIRKKVEERISRLDISDFEDFKRQFFLDAVLIVLDAVVAFANRFADLAEEEAKNADPKRKAELLKISENCRRVPEYPARNFREAVQSTWFIQLILQIESNGHSLSYGRLDQFLFPYYEKDIAEDKITREQASELLENLWIKTYTINKIRSYSHTRFSAGGPLYQNVTIGGQNSKGEDATNDLTYLVMQSVARIRFTQPNLTCRYHKNAPAQYMKVALEVVKLGFGMPAFNNDEIIIPSFLNLGVAKEDALNYSAIGCVEVSVPGKWGYRCTGMSFLNFGKVLMAALNDGIEPLSGKRIHPGIGKKFTEMETFEEVFDAWSKSVRYFTRQAVIMDTTADYALEVETPDILCSALTDDCIERGLTIKQGGAVYDFISGLQVGIANLGDSLAAIKKLVFEDKVLTKEKLWDAILNNFENENGERVRQLLLNRVPKFGNDDDYVDQLLHDAYMEFIDELSKYKNTRYGRGPIGGTYYAGTSSISANVPQGSTVGAMPDGRKARSPLAEGCSPSHGSDVNGPTAVLKSISKLPTDKITGGVLLNQKVSPSSLETETGSDKLISMIRTFFDELKGFHVQYNVVSRETLLDAQKHPEKHKNLIVRVAGYSAFFNVLSPETQNDIIARTEHTI
ncbi:MAG: glycyl radical protein [Saccharofermentanales bacterium]|jgi:pyruvate formate-lyase/glycerol dehydratase family glycyl radical enzyme